MARQALLGSKLRRLRRQHKLTQVALAGKLGISPSYLNLIEHNQRTLTRPLLVKLSETFEIDLRAFSGSEEARLLAELTEMFGDSLFHDRQLTRADLNELVGAAPDACRAILSLYRAYCHARDDVRGLSERLADDPFLSESNHQLLTLLTSIRSFSEILHDNVDLAATRRQQFVGILVEESEKLTHHVKQLFDFIGGEGLSRSQGASPPAEEVTDAFHRHANHFPELEDAAEALRRDCPFEPASAFQILAETLAARHAVQLDLTPEPPDGAAPWAFDADDARLTLWSGWPQSTLVFQLAKQLGNLDHYEILEALVAKAQLSSPAAEALYRDGLAGSFAGAVMMPYGPFLESAQALRHDLDLLAQRFGASFEQVCHRLTTLQRPGAEGVPFHFLRVDIAGNITKRFSGSGFRIPRYGGACPRWNVHGVFMRPGQIDGQLARLPDGSTYFSVARSLTKSGWGYHAPQSHYAICLGCEVSFARHLVYADGLELDDSEVAVPVGVSCRQCDRDNCRQRAHPSLLQ
jgi:predicted transcriptional regulator/transcriptional regulator with XRE-family HTH domain